MPLTTEMGVKAPQIVLGTLVNHYFGARNEGDSQAKDELVYVQAFNVIKSFLDASTRHTVEELQEFSNIRVPSPITACNPRVLIPISCCDDAANHLISVLGGEVRAKKIVGGTKWWQVRGIKGVDAQWVSQRKDWEEAKRRTLQRKKSTHEKDKKAANGVPHVGLPQTEPEPDYSADMDEMRCMLYLHGGGYYFGSVDQERYIMQRFGRKMSGRVFAVNYRLAPQYPFPCALQDCLAGYLFLIQPPPDAKHAAIPPSMIVIGGDSAGGGLALALLQVIRDAGLPAPAGGVLISPWCDLTHSFPSIHENTATDILPTSGLSIHRPSGLWPPPSEEMTQNMRQNLAKKILRFTRLGHHRNPSAESVAITSRGDFKTTTPRTPTSTAKWATVGHTSTSHLKVPSGNQLASDESGLSTSTPALEGTSNSEPSSGISLMVNGELVTLRSQVHLYCPNHLMTHPLVSPVTSYLGGLPPLFVMASDKEVLRDEILYMAHKAANPDNYPINPAHVAVYPPLNGIAKKHPGATIVHLQVYDETCHVLPMLSFCTPAKFAYRSIATFCKHVTPDRSLTKEIFSLLDADINFKLSSSPPSTPTQTTFSTNPPRNSSFGFGSFLGKRPTARTPSQPSATQPIRSNSSRFDYAGPRFTLQPADAGPGTAGHPDCYKETPLTGFIRERVSTKGTLRPMEPDSEIKALKMPVGTVGVINELSAKRYLEAQALWDKKFKDTLKTIYKQRQKNLEHSEVEDKARLNRLKESAPFQKGDTNEMDKVLNSANWSWAWVLAGDENPPSAALVARRDTAEARRLSKIADEAVEEKERTLSGNNLWTIIVNTLTKGPDPAPSPPPTLRNKQSLPDNFRHPMSPTVPTSPSRVSFRSHGMASTTSLTSPSIRSRRPSFGSVRLFGTRRGSNMFDANGDPLSHRHSVVGDAPPTLDVPVLDSNISRDEAFIKSALDGIAEVRVSQENQRPLPPKLDTTSPTTPKPLHNPPVSSPLSRKEGSAPPPTTLGDIDAAGAQLDQLSSHSIPLRKTIPTELFETRDVPTSTSPTSPTDALSSSGHKGQEPVASPENGRGDRSPTENSHVPSIPA